MDKAPSRNCLFFLRFFRVPVLEQSLRVIMGNQVVKLEAQGQEDNRQDAADAFYFKEGRDKVGGSGKKPCRACTDFRSWARFQAKKRRTKGEGNKEVDGGDDGGDQREHLECPLDKDELGRRTWGLLHTMAAYYPDQASKQQQKEMSAFLKLFSKYYPCEHCAQDFQKSIKENPPETAGQGELAQWLCRQHNEVNRKLGKPEFDCGKVDERWRDGWKDGSCD